MTMEPFTGPFVWYARRHHHGRPRLDLLDADHVGGQRGLHSHALDAQTSLVDVFVGM
jgi:hypothetical protein